ncbi:MAG: AMP-binding protein [Rhodococcus sp.]|nr:AMP-binding protein [Rhodococcus sp. (in: high G+C Gram-positive bacteria)]
MLQTSVREHPSRTAVIDASNRWTYRELDTRIEVLAAGLAELGISAGERVMVQIPNRVEFVQTIFALFRIGALPVFCLPAHRSAELTALGRASEAVAIITAHIFERFDHAELALSVAAEVDTIGHVIGIPEANCVLPNDVVDFTALRGAPREWPEVDPGAVAFLQLSGGSTGIPKLIPRTHDDYLYSVIASNRVCGVTSSTVYMATLPVAHNFPMSSPGILGAFAAGGTVALTSSPAPSVAFDMIEQASVTMTGMVPPLARLWTETAEKNDHGFDISTLETVLVGGARCPDELASRIGPALGVQLQQVFGMAEGLVCYTRLDDPAEIVTTTQGRPMSEYDQVRVVDDEGNDVADGEEGALLTQGPYTIRGYYNNPEANARSFIDGWYRTGDIVKRDAAGNITVCGRDVDRINRGGEKVSAEEVEEQLLAHPAVRDAVVVAIPDEYLGERTCAFVLVAEGVEPPRGAAIRKFVRERGLAAWKIPDAVTVLDAFPETGVGKTSRKELRKLLTDRG